ncbi:hypothetical protein ACO2FJ_04690 [Staphylococcus warneri]
MKFNLFLDIPRKLSPLETLHIAFKSHHINFIYNQMDKTEQDCIKSMLDSYDNPVLINEDIKHKCNLSERLGFIFKTSTNTFMVDTHYLNQINTYVFANHYQNKVQDEDGQLLIQQLDQLDKELFQCHSTYIFERLFINFEIEKLTRHFEILPN